MPLVTGGDAPSRSEFPRSSPRHPSSVHCVRRMARDGTTSHQQPPPRGNAANDDSDGAPPSHTRRKWRAQPSPINERSLSFSSQYSEYRWQCYPADQLEEGLSDITPYLASLTPPLRQPLSCHLPSTNEKEYRPARRRRSLKCQRRH